MPFDFAVRRYYIVRCSPVAPSAEVGPRDIARAPLGVESLIACRVRSVPCDSDHRGGRRTPRRLLRIRYQTIEFGKQDIHVRGLRNLQEYDDTDGVAADLGISSARWSMFGVLWASSHVLAHRMARTPIQGRRVLEVGSGLALASLILNRLGADITATDRHPRVEAFLNANTELNGDPPIPFVRASWTDEDVDLGQYDLIIGSDLLYEQRHGAELSAFVLAHAAPDCEVVMVDGGRGERGTFDRGMAAAGFVREELEILPSDRVDEHFKGRAFRYVRGETPWAVDGEVAST